MAETLVEIFERFARDEFHNASPLYERLSQAIARDRALLGLAAHCQKDERIPNLFFAAVHSILLSGVSHPVARFYKSLGGQYDEREDPVQEFRSFCFDHAEKIRELVAVRRVQTNEVGRCAGLMPAFAVAAQVVGDRPLYLVDIGAAAGLNLYWDHYGYRYGDQLIAGNTNSPVQIPCALRGPNPPPLPPIFPHVVERVGVDVNPLDVKNEADVLWLRALVWPEQEERSKRLFGAIEIARRQSVTLLPGDGIAVLANVMAGVSSDAVLCIMRVFTQLTQDDRERWTAQIAEYATSRDIVVITVRARGRDDSKLVLTSIVNRRRCEWGLAYMQNHGNWLEWL